MLLSAPLEVLLERVASRKTNNYGKTAEQREEIIHYVKTVEPLLRAGVTLEIDTRKPLDQVATELELIAKHPAGQFVGSSGLHNPNWGFINAGEEIW